MYMAVQDDGLLLASFFAIFLKTRGGGGGGCTVVVPGLQPCADLRLAYTGSCIDATSSLQDDTGSSLYSVHTGSFLQCYLSPQMLG